MFINMPQPLHIPKDPRQEIRDLGTSALSKITGMSEYNLTRKRPSILQTIAGKMGIDPKRATSTQATSTQATSTPVTATSTRKTTPKPLGGGVSNFKPFRR